LYRGTPAELDLAKKEGNLKAFEAPIISNGM
jgi:hypothetical protein